LLIVNVVGAQLTPIGLSDVRAQWFANEDPAGSGSGGTAAGGSVRGVPGDSLGAALAAGDFNCDAIEDLATGVPGDADPGAPNEPLAGSVHVRYGVAGRGLAEGPAALVLRQAPEEAFSYERFGAALAAGDFDGDGCADLAVGIPNDGWEERGAVLIYHGHVSGLLALSAEYLDEISTSEPQHACASSRFGAALAAGNFDGDAFADLAIGVPSGCDNLSGLWIPGGSVFVAHGAAIGLVPFLGYRMSLNSFGFDPVEAEDRFGQSVAVGDFDADGHDDLAIGIPGEGGHGAVQIVMGSPFGLLFADNAFWAPGALGELPEFGDALGSSLASGDFDGDGHDDLAIGSPFENLDPENTVLSVGTIAIAYGASGPAWFDLARTDRIRQGSIYGAGEDEPFDLFGWSLAAGDFDGDSYADLAIGHLLESELAEHGAVTILMGDADGLLLSSRFRELTPGRQGVPGDPLQGEQLFGTAVASADFDGSGFADLAIGIPGFEIGLSGDVGAEIILYGSLFADGFEIGATARWSNSVGEPLF
jgi:hypothetical protein